MPLTEFLHVRGTGPFEVIESDAPAPAGWQRMTRADYATLAATYTPPAPPAPVPAEVAAWRIKAVAKLAGLDAAIAAALAALPEPTRTVATAAWNEGNVIRRDSATVQQLAPALNLTSAQIDDLFRQADAIQV